MTSRTAPGRILLGHINGVFGVRGWVKVWSDTSPPDAILGYRQWWLGDGRDWKRVEVIDGKRQGKTLVVQLKGCDDRDQAEALRGRQIAVDEAALPELPGGEYYWYQLVGLEVRLTSDAHSEAGSAEGTLLGRVDHLLETGANDVVVVAASEGSIDDRERLIPWIPDQVIVKIDLDAGCMWVDWDPEF